MINEFKQYYDKACMMQRRLYQGWNYTEKDIADDLIWNVPIYDVVNRKYAAFSSFLEAVKFKDKDPKGNGKYFTENVSHRDFITLCYLFRLCGSGINYKPKKDEPFGTHGFGNFWIVEGLQNGFTTREEWIRILPEKKFSDSKGYLLPMIKKGLYRFIKENAYQLVDYVLDNIKNIRDDYGKVHIYKVVDLANDWLVKYGFKKQNFVLCAFAMDLAEYYPHIVSRTSDVYVGSNAKKCLKQIFPGVKGMGSNLRVTNDALSALCKMTGNISNKYDMEDVACDFIRYLDNFQSEDHIKMNNGIKYYNVYKQAEL